MKKLKRSVLAVVSCLTMSVSVSCFANSDLTTDVEKESYSIGASFGHHISSQVYGQTQLGAEVDMGQVVNGLLDALQDETKMSKEEIVTYLNQRAETLNAAKQVKLDALTAKNVAAGEAFMAENRKNSDVKQTDSGLQYEVITLGDGTTPQGNDVVTVHYKGTLIDGTEFDSTYERDEPNRFSLVTVIEGWQEALALMPQGSKFKLTIPPALAYGDRVVGMIQPHSTLVFEVELVKVEAPGEGSHGMGLSGMGMGGMMGGMTGANPHK
ncbi:FKBP-type peptidyl-prolyl cis-trans isomerase [Shewanella sp. D64]|uniref:FKBP-type peptidyl-prolyl cis-trans isomerase n=1 Tax=unclassified Shewanella TaxID=196818 RepID=UPI0022BA5783|nr:MULTISPECIES: FKBP-type peptidyl-prolyl cis-trans isomerase [unclassified Shewanella]MEC4728009.1 FKBP-type peptidyl-prolyl cis-trans isomerase [Shewanella sp. D64]MEC4740146.1 FKBP-type peptidyl-prolyl cis-trans isomerase [Shewanella sp. E94]WBJ95206.1 FKBP-type peptidyl-prolyl cis-trans isomerase [Shewanella sp. MTB7]